MIPKRRAYIWFALVTSLVPGDSFAQSANGSIEGRVLRTDDSPLPGVSVVVNEASLTDITDASGRFAFLSVPVGSYTLSFALGANLTTASVAVAEGTPAVVEQRVDWDAGFAETVTVYAASRRLERIVEAPAAVTIVDRKEIEQDAAHGQLPKVLEFTPGAELTQSGLYDFNFNTRGFNSSLNRRVALLIDGRDPSVSFLGAQEWAALSFPLDDLANVELLRGPSAALYGANASSGVLNLTSRQPRYSQGGALPRDRRRARYLEPGFPARPEPGTRLVRQARRRPAQLG